MILERWRHLLWRHNVCWHAATPTFHCWRAIIRREAALASAAVIRHVIVAWRQTSASRGRFRGNADYLRQKKPYSCSGSSFLRYNVLSKTRRLIPIMYMVHHLQKKSSLRLLMTSELTSRSDAVRRWRHDAASSGFAQFYIVVGWSLLWTDATR